LRAFSRWTGGFPCTQAGMSWRRDTSYATVGIGATTDQVLGTVVRLTPDSYFIDVDSLVGYETANNGDVLPAKSFNMLAGIMGSACEGAVFSQFDPQTSPGVSTVSILQEAMAEGVPLVEVKSSNAASSIRELSLSAGVTGAIRDAVAQGMEVVAPARAISIGSWRGAGYVVVDPDTGNAGFMIQEDRAGGFFDCDNLASIGGAALAAYSVVNPAVGFGIAATVVGCAQVAGSMARVAFSWGHLQAYRQSHDMTETDYYENPMQSDYEVLMGAGTVALGAFAAFQVMGIVQSVATGNTLLSIVSGVAALAAGFVMTQFGSFIEDMMVDRLAELKGKYGE
jgi:hypothetical protein